MSTANAFGIEPETLSQAVGITVDDMNAVAKGVRTLEPDGPQYGRAAFLSDWLQRLLIHNGGNIDRAREWLSAVHPRLETTPMLAMKSVEGLIGLSMIPFSA